MFKLPKFATYNFTNLLLSFKNFTFKCKYPMAEIMYEYNDDIWLKIEYI